MFSHALFKDVINHFTANHMEHYSNYFKFINKMLIPNCSENFKSVCKKYFNMSHQDLVLQALGMDNYDNAVDLMKQIADEFITEQENEDKLNHEIDALLDGEDFSEPLSPMDQIDSTSTQDEVNIT